MTMCTSLSLDFDDLSMIYHETLLKIMTSTKEDSEERKGKLNALHAFMNIPDIVSRGTEIVITPSDTQRATMALLNAYSSLFYSIQFKVKR